MSNHDDNVHRPLRALGDDFEPEAMPDYAQLVEAGTFDDMTVAQVKQWYLNREEDDVEHDEMLDMLGQYPRDEED